MKFEYFKDTGTLYIDILICTSFPDTPQVAGLGKKAPLLAISRILFNLELGFCSIF